MTNIQETFAKNLRENRRKSGLTQAKLAEKADISTHYVALIELARNIPKVEVIQRLANALNVEIYELFLVPHSPTKELEKMRELIITELKDIIKETVEEAFENERNLNKKRK